MKLLCSILCIVLLQTTSCRRVDFEFGVSNCIREKIVRFSKYTCPKSGNVMEFEFHKKLVYVFSQGNCPDELNAEVVDSNCAHLGFVSKSSTNIIEGENF